MRRLETRCWLWLAGWLFLGWVGLGPAALPAQAPEPPNEEARARAEEILTRYLRLDASTDFGAARKELAEAAELFAGLGEEASRARVLLRLSMAHLEGRDQPGFERYFEETFAATEAAGDGLGLWTLGLIQATMALDRSDTASAEKAIDRALVGVALLEKPESRFSFDLISGLSPEIDTSLEQFRSLEPVFAFMKPIFVGVFRDLTRLNRAGLWIDTSRFAEARALLEELRDTKLPMIPINFLEEPIQHELERLEAREAGQEVASANLLKLELPAFLRNPVQPAPPDEEGDRADSLLADALTLETTGDLAVGEQKLEEALGLYAERGDRLAQIAALSILARFRMRTRSVPEALACFDRAEAIANQSGHPFETSLALLNRGYFERRQGLDEQAADHLTRSLESLRRWRHDDTPLDLQRLVRLMTPAMRQANSVFLSDALIPPALRDAPFQVSEALLSLVKPFLLDIFESDALAVLAGALLDVGRLEEAAVRLAEAPLQDHPDVLEVGARLAQKQGDGLRARRLAYQALEAAAKIPSDQSLENSKDPTSVLETIDIQERVRGNPHDTRHWEAALERARRDRDLALETRILSDFGYRLGTLGQPTEARAHLERAVTLAQQLGRPGLERNAREHLSTVLMLLGEHENAVRELEHAIELSRKRNDADYLTGTLISQGQAQMLVGAGELGLLELETAQQRAETRSDAVWVAAARHAALFIPALSGAPLPVADLREALISSDLDPMQSEILIETFDLFNLIKKPDQGSQLRQQGNKLLNLAQRAGNPFGEMIGRLGIATGYTYEQRCAEAQIAFENLLEALRRSPGMRDLEVFARFGLAAAFWAQGDTGAGLQLMRETLAKLEEIRTDFRTGELLAGFEGGGREHLYFAMVEMLIHTGADPEAFEITERARARAFLQQLGAHTEPAPTGNPSLLAETETLRSRLRELDEKLAATPPDNPSQRFALAEQRDRARLEYEQLRLRIALLEPEHAAQIEPDPISLEQLQHEVLDADTTLLAFYTGIRNRLYVWVVDRNSVERVSLEIRADRLAAELTFLQHEIISQKASSHYATSLYQELITPLLPHLRRPKLILVPHGPLHQLPFAALRDPATGKLLVEQFTLTHAPSASSLHFLKARRSPFEGRSLVLGDPDSKLPGSRHEAEAVAAKLGTSARLGPEASESEIYRHSGQLDLLHLAAHASFDDPRPRFSYVKLAADTEADGRLDLHEVAERLDLRGTDLVVLSACETGLGRTTGGDEVIGMTRTFLLAGSSAVVSTLWQVRDDASMVLIDHFYTHLAAGETAAEALRAAQLEVMRHPGWEAPYFWAGFTLHGDGEVRLVP